MKKIAARHYFWIVPLIFIVSGPIWWFPVKTFLTPRTDESSGVGQAMRAAGKNFSLDDIVFTQNTKGKKQWQVKARQLYTAGSEEDLRLEDIEARFFGEAGKQSALIIGDRGRYRSDLQELTVSDNVVITTESGYTVRTQKLRYLEQENQLVGEKGVTVEGERFHVTGERLRYDIVREDVMVEGRVVCQVY